MLRPAILLLAMLVPHNFVCAQAADAWGRLKIGMSQEDATAVLGDALVASSGRGFGLAIYDRNAEVLYHEGRVIAWTPPAMSGSVPPVSTWSFAQEPQIRLGRAPASPGTGTSGAASAERNKRLILPAYRL